MGSCPQGHPVPTGFDFCGTCGAQVVLAAAAMPQVVEASPDVIPPRTAEAPGAVIAPRPEESTGGSVPWAPSSTMAAPARPRPSAAVPEQRNGVGRTAVILGCLSLITAPVVGLGVVAGVLAVAFGEAGLARVRGGTATNRHTAGWGVLLGLVGAVVSVALLRYYQLLADSGISLLG
jgi:hypothetical protein